MISKVHVRNFQSLRNVELDLGTFTVIVGPSSSGKSALIRAFKALASNVRGAGVITRGQKTMSVTAWTDSHVIELQRTERGGHYALTRPPGDQDVFAKLNGGVPQQITDALRIAPVTENGSVNFAGQFDRPYLLDESGSAVARQLGELTNVNQIFEAVRAAVRIRNNTATTLKNRRADLELLRTRLADYQGLSAKLELLQRADTLDSHRRDTQDRLERLQAAIDAVEDARQVLAEVKVTTPPDRAAFDKLCTRFTDLPARVAAIESKADRLRRIELETEALAHSVDHLEMDLKTNLIRAKVCPTCGQATSDE